MIKTDRLKKLGHFALSQKWWLIYRWVVFAAGAAVVLLALIYFIVKTDTNDLSQFLQEIIFAEEKGTEKRDEQSDKSHFIGSDSTGTAGIYDSMFSNTEALNALYSFDLSKIPAGERPIKPMNISSADVTALANFTSSLNPDTSALLNGTDVMCYKAADGGLSEPLVLIYHSHSTESYTEAGNISVGANNETHSTDVSKTVVAVGEAMTKELEARGIPTLHCTTMHDADDFSNAYINSKKSILEYLEKYPSIQYVFDVHRDSLSTEEGYSLKPVTLYKGKPTAQIMFVVGTNEGGAYHPDWEKNLTFALNLQQVLTDRCSTLMRNINLRSPTFNEQYRNCSLLIEIGTDANTLDEAKSAAIVFADSLSDIILGTNKNNL